MKDQIVMSKANAELAIAVPLFRYHHEQELTKLKGYSVALTNSKPIAYVLDCDDGHCPILNAEFVESHVEFLGEL
jgi:hypothetical protein